MSRLIGLSNRIFILDGAWLLIAVEASVDALLDDFLLVPFLVSPRDLLVLSVCQIHAIILINFEYSSSVYSQAGLVGIIILSICHPLSI